MGEHRETLRPSSAFGGESVSSKTDGPSVTPDKASSDEADATRSGPGKVAATNHEHIYALREIIKPSVNVRRGEEQEVNECAPSPIHHSPRIITSRVVRSSCGVYKKLEENTTGTVLCEQRSDDETIFGNRLDSFDSSESRAPLAIAAVPFSSVRKQLECPEVTSTHGCDRLTSQSPDGKQKNKKRRRALRLMTQLSNLIPLKHLENRPVKSRFRRRKPSAQQVMVITDDAIDWSRSSRLLDGLEKSSKPRIIVRESRTSPDSFDENEQIVVQNVTEDPSIGSLIYSEEVVMNNSLPPVNEIVTVSRSLGIYICESGLNESDCNKIISVSEICADMRGGWSSYTYAKQTLGCRHNGLLAFAAARPVMTACSTIRAHLPEVGDESSDDHEDDTAKRNGEEGGDAEGENVNEKNDSAKELVLDIREPHVVKYDLSRTERQKLELHTDKSTWTFLIALSEGRGTDYSGGGTFFQALNSTVHLQRGQMLIFRGKLRHAGVRISWGCRYLLVGFLVPAKNSAP